ncbi:hypothetical protein HID58_066368 [Brassica napus]|uniref:Uncharacterized protein n=1 Tax=Brassica napus TaxID=3708 RepID=A0ABQ7ZFH5_BRANA|nr:hypothetical protein HID58_066368 [Brassica napus]
MYIKNFSAFQQKLTMEDQNKPFTTTRGHAGQIVGRKNSEKVRMRKKKGSLVTDNVSVIGQRWNYPSNEKIIDFVQESICYANQINT